MCSLKGHRKRRYLNNIRVVHSASVSRPVADGIGEDECQQ